PVETAACDSLFEVFHAGQVVLDADGVEALDDVGLDAQAHVLATLHKKRLVDEIFQRSFLVFFDLSVLLFRGAFAAAILHDFFGGGFLSFVEFGARDDFVVYAGDDFFDGLGVGAFGNLFAFFGGVRGLGACGGGIRRFLGRRFRGGLRGVVGFGRGAGLFKRGSLILSRSRSVGF